MSVQTQSMHKSHSIARFQINSRRGSLVYFIFQPCVLNLWRGWWVIDFQVPKRLSFAVVLYKSSSIFILGNRFSLFGSSIFFNHFTSILQKFSRLSYNSYLHLSLFCRGSLIPVLAFGFISHTTRISNKASFLRKRLVNL